MHDTIFHFHCTYGCFHNVLMNTVAFYPSLSFFLLSISLSHVCICYWSKDNQNVGFEKAIQSFAFHYFNWKSKKIRKSLVAEVCIMLYVGQ